MVHLPSATIANGAIIRVIGGVWSPSLGVCVRIEDHLALHDSAIRAWVFKNVYGDFKQDAYQNIVEAMIEAHEKGWYKHENELLTYLWPYLRGIAFRGLDPEYRYGIKDELDQLQEMAERQDRDRIHLDPLYESPIPGLRPELEQSLMPEEQAQVAKLLANLQDEDREILKASYRMSERDAAASLGMPKTTYRERLARAKARAIALLKD
jgi:RNA polymerase sigma factor (sigma-70 family)